MKNKFWLTLLLLPIVSYGQIFTSTLYPVCKDKKWGYINNKGEEIIGCNFKNAKPFKEGMALIETDTGILKFIDTKGETVFKISTDVAAVHTSYSEGMVSFKDKWGRFGFFDKKGNIKITSKYKSVKEFSDGLAAVQNPLNNRWGFIDKSGKLVIPFLYNKVGRFNEGFAPFMLDDDSYKWGIMDKSGKIVKNHTHSYITSFSENIAGIWDYSSYAKFINIEQKELFTLKIFESTDELSGSWSLPIYKFSNGLLKYKDSKSQKFGFLDKKGRIEIRCSFEEAGDFFSKRARVKSGSKWGYIKKNGDFAIRPEFDDAEDFKNGLAAVFKGGSKTDFYNGNAELKISMAYINRSGDIVWDFSK